MNRILFKTLVRSALALTITCWAFAAQSDTGIVNGRVFNAATGAALPNARISVPGTSFQTLTDESGQFSLRGIPPGEAQLVVSYLGLENQTAMVQVTAGGVAERDFDLVRAGVAGSSDAPVKLGEFVVAEGQLGAQELAINEKRHAANLKEVVAFGEIGDQSDENIADFMGFIPGVSIVSDAPGAGTISVRGFPPAVTPVMIDGGEFSGSRDGGTRNVALFTVPTANISRVEVTKSPTPDKPASNLGGSVDLISKTGFDVMRPQLSYQVTTQWHNTYGWEPKIDAHNHIKRSSPRYNQPSFNVSYLAPINKNFAINAGISRTWGYRPPPKDNDADEGSTWDYVRLVQTQSTWQSIAWVQQTWSGDFGADWRFGGNNTLSLRTKYRDASSVNSRNVFDAIYGAGATGDATHTQGASTGVGSVRMANAGAQSRVNDSLHNVLKYERRGDTWHITATGARSGTGGKSLDADRGFFTTAPSTIANIVLRGDGIPGGAGENLPTRYSAVTRTGAPVDVYDGGGYSINNTTSAQRWVSTSKTRAALDLARDVPFAVPFRVKLGADWRQERQQLNEDRRSWNFRPNGSADVTARMARNFDVFDEDLNASFPSLYGQPVRWISVKKLYDLYLQRPDWFVLNEVGRHQEMVNRSHRYIETVSAAYLRTDFKFLDNRLLVVGGTRFEQTNFAGYGALNDPAARYQRNAAGDIVRNAAGQPVMITSDPLAQAKLQYQYLGAHSESEYKGLYPSLNATYNITDRLLLRAAYARTIGRPQVSVITPGTTFSEPDAINQSISVSNPALKPWTADSYDLALESYILKGGYGSISLFQKSITNFHGSLTQDATPELLGQYGIPNEPEYLGYDIVTTTNVGDAKIQGLELSYRQFLTFIPRVGQNLQVFGHYSKLDLNGRNTADFAGYVPESLSGGISFIRPRYYLKLTVKHQGDTRIRAVAQSATVPAGAYDYVGERTTWGISAQVSLSKRLSLFASSTDFRGGVSSDIRYAPGTPDYAKPRRIQENGYFITFGIRGEY